ncbi:MAG: hypothetical protein LUO93_06550 [Methanomicrobiales archaeon]|nr:hypothetical protein [Methanomicrobiales archaeon]
MRSIYRFPIPVLLLGFLLLSCVFASGCLRESALTVRGMSVGAEAVDPSRVTLNVTTEIEKYEGFGSGTPMLQLRAFNIETGILEIERTDVLPGIGWGDSRTAVQTIDLPRKGSYRLVATVYEGESRKAQGEITVYNLDRLIPDSQQTGLVIGDIDFIARKVSGDSVDLQTDLYIGNDDPFPSGAFEVEVKAKELDAHLVTDKKTVHIDNIDPEKIYVASVLLTVPDQYNYLMEVLIWKNGTIIKRGEGTIQLRPGTTLPAGDQFVTKKIETSKFVSEEGLASPGVYPTPPVRTPGFSALPAVMAFAAAGGIVLAWRRRR